MPQRIRGLLTDSTTSTIAKSIVQPSQFNSTNIIAGATPKILYLVNQYPNRAIVQANANGTIRPLLSNNILVTNIIVYLANCGWGSKPLQVNIISSNNPTVTSLDTKSPDIVLATVTLPSFNYAAASVGSRLVNALLPSAVTVATSILVEAGKYLIANVTQVGEQKGGIGLQVKLTYYSG